MINKGKPTRTTGTMTRCTVNAKRMILALAKRIDKDNAQYLREIGINKASSTVAIDALLYWAAMDGHLNGKEINSKNNIYCKLMGLEEEDQHE